MIVKLVFSPEYQRMIECDIIHRGTGKNELRYTLYSNGKLVEDLDLKDAVDVFIMENGKTVDRMTFRPEGIS